MKTVVGSLTLFAVLTCTLVAQEVKKYKITIAGNSFEVEVEELKPEPTPTPDPTPDPTPSTMPLNIKRLADAGWKVEPKQLLQHPSAQDIKDTLIPPAVKSPTAIAVKRLWIPQVLTAENYDPDRLALAISKSANSVHKAALRAWYELQIKNNQAGFDSSMKEAKAAFNTQLDAKLANNTPFPQGSTVLMSNRYIDLYAACFALDWIQWNSTQEFEDAFGKVKALLEADIKRYSTGEAPFATGNPKTAVGYWSANMLGDSPYAQQFMLASTAYGINPDKPSHTWADDVINRLELSPYTDPKAVFSPWHEFNVSNIISLGEGGGREWGAYEGGPSLGGYETYHTQGIIFCLKCADTATGSKWKLVDNSQYIQTRWFGLVAIDDLTVEKTAFAPTGAFCVEMMARLCNNDSGHYYSYLTQRSPKYQIGATYVPELQALCGPKPQPLTPTGTLFDRVGSRLYYKADQSKPDTTYRWYQHYRNIDDHREMGDDRCSSIAIGSVGLVSGHVNRCAPSSPLANGVYYGPKSAAGDPIFADVNYWQKSQMVEIHHADLLLRNVMPEEILSNPLYLKGTQEKPVLVNGVYTWTRDWTESSGITKAVTKYEFNETDKTLVLTDNITYPITPGNMLSWHFSPTHTPQFTDTGFSFGDNKNTITVTIEANCQLTRVVHDDAHPFNMDTFTLPIEWHKTAAGTKLNRMVANVGYIATPNDSGIYQVKTTIKAQ